MQKPGCQNTVKTLSGCNEDDLLMQKQQIRLENFKKHLGGIKQRLRQVTSSSTAIVNIKSQNLDDKENNVPAYVEKTGLNLTRSPACPASRLADKGCSAKTLCSPSLDLIQPGLAHPTQKIGANLPATVPDGAFSFRKVENADTSSIRGSPCTKSQSHPLLPSSTPIRAVMDCVSDNNQKTAKRDARVTHESQTLQNSGTVVPNNGSHGLPTIQEESASQPPKCAPHYLRFSPVKQMMSTANASHGAKHLTDDLKISPGLCHASSPNFSTLRPATSGITQELSLSEAYLKSRAQITKSMIRPRSNPPSLFGPLSKDDQEDPKRPFDRSRNKQTASLAKQLSKIHKGPAKRKQSPDAGKKSLKSAYNSINNRSVDDPMLSVSSSAVITPSFQRTKLRSVDKHEQEGLNVSRKLFLHKESVENTVETVRLPSTGRLGKDPLRYKGIFASKPTNTKHKLGSLDHSQQTRRGSQMRKRLNLSGADSQQNTSCKLNQSSINTSVMELKHSSSKDTTSGQISTALIHRLVKGARAQVSSREMKSRTGRLYQELPEVKAMKLVQESKEVAVQRVQRIKAYDSVVLF